MEGQVDLNQLIKKDKQEAKRTKTHHIQKQSKQPASHPHRDFNNRRSHHHDRYQERSKQEHYQKKPRVYALLVTGFVSDVSTQDIYNLAKDRKVISISTCLKGKDNQLIDPKINSNMEVIITFANQEDSDSFIQQYSNKLLDGKHSLTFQYRRAY